MSMSLAYLSRVSNLRRADGGRDQESLDEVKLRARRELQAQRRAVTPQDYEQFALKYSREVSRAKCLTPNDSRGVPTGAVSVLAVPSVSESVKGNDLSKLHLQDNLRKELHQYLDQFRLMTTILNIREPEYLGVKVKVKVVPQDYLNPLEVTEKVIQEINRYITPLPLDEGNPLVMPDEQWNGWPFGRDLFIGEIMSLVQQIPEVKYVMDLEMYSRELVPVEENTLFDDEPKPVTPVERVLKVPADGLLCSLDHEVIVADLQER
jgi:predicted phage baseplate assembly protein